MIVATEFEFDAAHNLPNYAGKCERLHGHTYRLRVFCEAPVDPSTGLAVPSGRSLSVYVEPQSNGSWPGAPAPYLAGTEIDWVEGLQAGFAINNPNVSAACGCGHSFQVEEGDAPEEAAGCGSCH